MRTTIKSARRIPAERRNANGLPDGIGGTIAGGPMKPLDLMQILGLGGRDVSLGGVISGAAQIIASGPPLSAANGRDIALSDGSRISFASMDDVRALAEA